MHLKGYFFCVSGTKMNLAVLCTRHLGRYPDGELPVLDQILKQKVVLRVKASTVWDTFILILTTNIL